MQGVGFLLVIYLLCEFFLFLNKGTFITGLKRMIYKGLRDIGDIKVWYRLSRFVRRVLINMAMLVSLSNRWCCHNKQ